MAITLFETDLYSAHQMRDSGGCIIHKPTNESVYFQPGDDMAALLNAIESLEEVPENSKTRVFNVLCSVYL